MKKISNLPLFLLVILAITFFVMFLWTKKELGEVKADLRLAEDIAWSYNTSRDEAVGSDVSKAVACLERLRLPPGTKAFSGAGGVFVERERQRALRDIIAYLRAKTNKDFGDTPERWVEELSNTNKTH